MRASETGSVQGLCNMCIWHMGKLKHKEKCSNLLHVTQLVRKFNLYNPVPDCLCFTIPLFYLPERSDISWVTL